MDGSRVYEHVEAMLELRVPEERSPAGRARAEQLYRRRVMELVGAEPVPGLDPPQTPRRRRVEGWLRIPGEHGELFGLVVFALGNSGRGASADIRSKDGQPSAHSLLKGNVGADFVLLLTTLEPHPKMQRLADAKSDIFTLAGHFHRRIWLMGLPELVAREEAFRVAREAAGRMQPPWWRRWFLRAAPPASPVSPLAMDMWRHPAA